MKVAYAVRITKNNLPGLRHVGYAKKISDEQALGGYFVLSGSGLYVVEGSFFEETYEFSGGETSVEFHSGTLLEFGASKDERTLLPFVPKNLDEDHWNSFTMKLFNDDYASYEALFEKDLSV